LKETVSKLNEDLNRVNEWLSFSKLLLNVNKTKAVLVTPRPIDSSDLQIVIGGDKLDFFDNI